MKVNIGNSNLLPKTSMKIEGNNNRKKIAVACPVHPPKFNFLRNCIYTFYKHGLNLSADFWIVFSTFDDAVKFEDFERFLIIPEGINLSTKGVINIKKLYALSELTKMGYDYVITIDADFAFNRNVNFVEICNRFFAEKIIISCVTNREFYVNINAQCLSRFAYNPNSKNIPVNLYSWLNQPCIYKTDNVSKFFSALGNLNLNQLRWEDFDYILYTYYLVLYEDFRLYPMQYWSSELPPLDDARIIINTSLLADIKNVHFLVCNKQLYFSIQKNYPDNEIMMIIHLDR